MGMRNNVEIETTIFAEIDSVQYSTHGYPMYEASMDKMPVDMFPGVELSPYALWGGNGQDINEKHDDSIYNESVIDAGTVADESEPLINDDKGLFNFISKHVQNHVNFRLMLVFAIAMLCAAMPIIAHIFAVGAAYYVWCVIAVFLCLAAEAMVLRSIYNDTSDFTKGIDCFVSQKQFRFENNGKYPNMHCNTQGKINQMFSEIEHIEQTNKELITNISHEIRTPLSSLKLTSEAMIDGVFPMDEEHISMLSSDVDKIESTFNAIKEYTRIANTKSTGRTNLYESLQRIQDSVYDRAFIGTGSQNVSCKFNVDRTFTKKTYVGISSDKLERLCSEIVDNSFCHAQMLTCITIDAQPSNSDDIAVIKISDDGCGTNATQKQIVTPFWKEDESHTTSNKHHNEVSLGLGMSVASSIASMCGGWLEIESSAGHGMQVSINLPVVH